MGLGLHARLAERASFALLNDLSGEASVDVNQFSCEIDEDGESFRRVYSIVRRHENDFVRQTVDFRDDEKCFQEDQKSILGYVVDAPDLADTSSSESDFVTGSPQCGGRIRDDVQIDLTEKPTGIAVSLGDELIVQAEFLKLIENNQLYGRGSVRIRGKSTPDWHRLGTKRMHTLVHDLSFRSGICSACQSKCRFEIELWFARANKPVNITAFDMGGVGHLGQGDVLVVPTDLGDELKSKSRDAKRGGRWYESLVVSPLYSTDSSRYRLVELINELLDKKGDSKLQQFLPGA